MEASPLTPPRDPFQVLDNDVILQATRKSVEKGAQLQGGGGGPGLCFQNSICVSSHANLAAFGFFLMTI
jgi:hypothetical protein